MCVCVGGVRKRMNPSCHDAPVIVTDQIQCAGVCMSSHFVCLSCMSKMKAAISVIRRDPRLRD